MTHIPSLGSARRLSGSVKGCARIYMALAMMGQQVRSASGLLRLLAKACRTWTEPFTNLQKLARAIGPCTLQQPFLSRLEPSVRNFESLCTSGKDSIVRGV